MSIVSLPPRTLIADTYQKLSDANLRKLVAEGFKGVVRYLDNLDHIELAAIRSAGLAQAFVASTAHSDPQWFLTRLHALGIPKGAAVFIDIESVTADAAATSARINTFAKGVQADGYVAGAYFGAGQPLNSEEMWKLANTLYWHSCSRVVDRDGKEAAPKCGWTLIQLHPGDQQLASDLKIDANVLQHDYYGRSVPFML